MPNLPPTEPRCHDLKCGVHIVCRRWLEREDYADRHFSIMRPTYHCNDTPCDHFIPQEPT